LIITHVLYDGATRHSEDNGEFPYLNK